MRGDGALGALGLTLCTFALGCGGEGGGPTVPPPPRVVTSVEITPPGPMTSLGDFATLGVTVLDQNGASVTGPTVTWASLDPGIVTVIQTGRIESLANGSARITATASNVADTVTIVVAQQVAAVRITPSQPVLELVGDTVLVTGQPIDARGNTVASAGAVTWGATGAVTAQPSGLVTAVGFGVGTITATSDGVSSSVSAEVIGDRFFLSKGVRIRYELDLPNTSGGPFPAIIWVHGSGQLDRNAQRIGTDPLVPHGLAVLRYDKRGVGESGGVFVNIGPSNSFTALGLLADDAANAIRFLTRLPQIDTTRLGIMGNSQAGWIVPMAAGKLPGLVRYIMLWSGPTVSVGLEIFYSTLAASTNTPLDTVYAQLSSFNGVEGYDALADISSLTIPGMWQYGELDRSIPMRLDVERLDTLRAQGKPFEVVTWPFGDHALRDTRTGQFYDVWSEYLRFLRQHGILN